MSHLDPANRIQSINECLFLILEGGEVPNSAVKPKPIGLQSMMGPDWASGLKFDDNENKTSSPTIGAYDTSPEAENVRRITAIRQADKDVNTQLAGRQQTGNRMIDIGLNAFSPDSRFQELLGGVAAAVGTRSSPRVTQGSANSRGTYSLSGTTINRNGTRRSNRPQLVPSLFDGPSPQLDPKKGPILNTWDKISKAVITDPKPGESIALTTPIWSMKMAYGISSKEADLLAKRQTDAFNAISSPRAQYAALLMHGNPNNPLYFTGQNRVAMVDRSRNTHLDPSNSTEWYRGVYVPRELADRDDIHLPLESSSGYSLVDSRLPRTLRNRVIQHEIGHDISHSTLTPAERAVAFMGMRNSTNDYALPEDKYINYRTRANEIGARIRSSIVNYRRDMARFKETLGDALSPLKSKVLDVLTDDPDIYRENLVNPEVMDILKREYYPYFHVKKQEKNNQTRMA